YMRDAADHDDAVMVEISRPFLQNLRNTCAALGAFRTPLAELVRLGLDLNGEFPELTPAQRLYLLEKSELKSFHSTRKLYDRVQIEPRMLNYKELPIRPRETVPNEIIAEMKNSAVEPALFYRSDDIRALVFMEFIYMCSQNLAVRKCDYCGRYFLPFSSVSLYCDRIVDTERGRTCKEIAAMQKYNLKVYADAAKTLYRRNVNAYQMRCRRAPACYPHEEYERWKVDARRYLEQVEKGEILLEEFRERVAIPDVK
ncbi:DUF6076 domain-containing protein, partial [Ethanoligenens sp.]|uniref:DUF6076 domain-containing protein n=1 Tax=Ethanoligenens sp. TaxID=2099655 RepID=UPI0039E9C992